ncbi:MULTISPECIES: hypothetical protein [Streptomyces]|uniref:Lipoprotein n=1 Tax=Streptomyces koelreuteriae TaxID=2838015 RepID=A0ABX8FKA1_9ACTN|nr:MULTISPECIES: hypothetical protein [Streptomyces]QWB21526.1 hypothetical protein KJK29_02450 [Streptomyces koelreuteriae]UUA04448.1 hypothetical protein NNW98_02460 [Streptomyces koelreuteriae]UUA12073.1 hypothetical protein NNW99_02460 [Streptomyces sp. CRCS-T-1]
MSASTTARRAPVAVVGLGLVAILTLTACGDLHASGATAGATPGRSERPSPSASPSALGASPYVEPGAGDGAPHYNENNGHRRPGEMSPAHAKDAEREADRIRPVLERLWKRRTWDPATVREALLRLGYEEERVTADGERLGGTLTVKGMPSRWKDDRYVTPEGAEVALRVHDDACVMAFVQKTNFSAVANGPYPESGCFSPPFAH